MKNKDAEHPKAPAALRYRQRSTMEGFKVSCDFFDLKNMPL
jgi:hypothetical protein